MLSLSHGGPWPCLLSCVHQFSLCRREFQCTACLEWEVSPSHQGTNSSLDQVIHWMTLDAILTSWWCYRHCHWIPVWHKPLSIQISLWKFFHSFNCWGFSERLEFCSSESWHTPKLRSSVQIGPWCNNPWICSFLPCKAEIRPKALKCFLCIAYLLQTLAMVTWWEKSVEHDRSAWAAELWSGLQHTWAEVASTHCLLQSYKDLSRHEFRQCF